MQQGVSEKQTLFSNRALVALLIPLVIETALNLLVGMADTVMVSRVGEAAISGVSLVDMINNVIVNLFMALGTGGAVVTSQFLGARKQDSAVKSASQLWLLSLMIGLGVMAACIALRRPMLRFFFGGINEDVMAAALLYFLITALSYPCLAVYNAGAAVFRARGNSGLPMRVNAMMNILNVIGNAICIFGLHMGVEGVALPTLAARVLGALAMTLMGAAKDNPLRLTRDNMTHIDRNMSGRILYIGIPSALENCLFQFGRVIVVSMIAVFGTVHISANAVANNLDGLGIIVGQATSLAMITVIGQCVGARDEVQMRGYVRKMMKWVYFALGLSNVVIILGVNLFLKAYSLSAETQELSKILVYIHCGAAILLWPVSFVFPNSLRAANDVRYTMRTAIVSMMVFRVGLSYILCVKMGMGAVGVWIAMVADWICRASCFLWRYFSGKWRKAAGFA